ncbi:peptidylprolyl isomerase [Tateyamaria pelophila]|uniref:peptidylprolyl isomerase n=1 Tax=Tateyamaria pelophila TaxID=328415 RepID=UPI001CC00F2D|nr:peptidylprolyl isomerase [Tateyamaria pelophila]
MTVLGWDFSAQIRELEPGEWTGPIRSGRGWHLVRLDAFHPPKTLPPDELNRILREDWTQAYSQRSFERRLDNMRASYKIDLPSSMEPQTRLPDLLRAGTEPSDQTPQAVEARQA